MAGFNYQGRPRVLELTNSGNDADAIYDVVLWTVGAGQGALFILPKASLVGTHPYDIVLINLGAAASATIYPASGDTVNGSPGGYQFPAGDGTAVRIISDLQDNWVLLSASSQFAGDSTAGLVFTSGQGGFDPSPTVPQEDVNGQIDPLSLPVGAAGTLFTGTVTTASLVGKTITVANGIIKSVA